MPISPEPQFALSAGARPPRRLSAGRAWLLSSLLPGAGQIYCGATVRGTATAALFAAGIAGAIFVPGDPRWLAIRMLVFFYAFASLDAYRTAREHNRGIKVEAPANPRVAALLNLTTGGFGYVYLGEKFGCAVVVVVGIFVRAISKLLPLVGEAIVLALGIHAAQLAKKRRDEAFPPPLLPPPVPSRLPMAIPYVVSAVILLGYYGLATVGQIAMLLR